MKRRRFHPKRAPLSTRAPVERLERRLVLAAPAVGMNMDQVVDYAAAWTFTDAFKASRDWFSLSYNTATGEESWSGGGTPVVDSMGWPVELKSWTNQSNQTIQQRLGTLMYREIGGNYPAGVYRAQWRGTGTLAWGYDAAKIASGDNPDGSHWADLNVTPSTQGIFLRILSMPNAADPIRDMHVWVPDYNGQSFKGQVWQPGAAFSPFHPLFIERLQPFKTLRFMDWMKTNVSTNENWAERRKWDEANQTGDDGKGVALEYMVALANQIDADVWFNMPYKATDDFVSNFATYARDNLDPGLDVNVEWSNEIWNSAAGFNTYGWITQQLALPENAGKTRYQFAAQEIKRDFDVWSSVFANQPAGRLTRVVAGQAGNPTNVTEAILQNMEGKFDAVSCTGYFGPSSAQRATFNSSTTAEQIANIIRFAVPSAMSSLKTHKALGQQYGGGRNIKIYAYESGQHADGQGNANLPYLNALYGAQTHPLMYEAYDDFVRGLYDNNVDLAMHYTYVSRNDKSGSWGSLQSQTQAIADSPKYRSLTEAVAGTAYFPEYTITVQQASGDEFNAVPVTFQITRSGDKTLAQSVNIQLGGTASSGDYLNPGTVVNFAAGQATALLTVTPVDDVIIEDTETITVTLLPGTGYKLDNIATRITASANLVDDDGYVNVNLPIVNPNFETGDLTGWTKFQTPTSGTNIIAVAPPTPGGSVVNAPPAPVEGSRWAWGAGASGNQPNGALYAGISQTLSLGAHSVAIDAGIATLNFSAWGAAWSNDFAQLEVRYLDDAGAQLGATLLSNKAVTDKTWTKMTSNAAVPALARSVELRATMQRSGGSATDAGVDVLAARLTYPAVATVDVTASDASATEAAGNTGAVTFTRSGNLTIGEPLTIEYSLGGTATAGQDFASPAGSVTIPANSTSATVTITPVDDTIDEKDETVVVTLVGQADYIGGTSRSATVTIADNDLPAVTVSASDEFAAEFDEDAATFVVERLTTVLDQPLTVHYSLAGSTATSGADFQALSGVVTIPVNESIAAIPIATMDDVAIERDETVVVTLSVNSAYSMSSPNSATVTIVNDDHPRVTVTATDASASEVGADPATFTFTRTGEFVNEELTVYFTAGGSATPGADYSLPAEGITIAAGQLSAGVTITPIPDGLGEGVENVVITLLPNGGYTPGNPGAATAAIADTPPAGNAAPAVTGVFVSSAQWTTAFKNHIATSGAGEAAYGYRIDPANQLGVLPWTNADKVSIRFSEAVDVQRNDLVIRGSKRLIYPTEVMTYDAPTFTATWALSVPLIVGEKVLLDLDGESANAVKDLANAMLDGEWTTAGAPQLYSGNGTAAGDFRYRFNVLPGDANRNGSVAANDITFVSGAQGAVPGTSLYTIFKDLNGSGTIAANDVTLTRDRQGATLPAAEPIVP